MDDRKVTTLSESALEAQKAHADLIRSLDAEKREIVDAESGERAAARQRQLGFYQAAFDHVTTNRHQRRAREGLAKKAAAARKRAKKARHGK